MEEENFYNVKPKLEDEQTEEEKKATTLPPYTITASCQDYGMGCVLGGLNTFSIDACIYIKTKYTCM